MANLFLTDQGEYLFGAEEAYAGAEKTDLVRIGEGTLSRIVPILTVHKFEEITDLTAARALMAPFYVIDCDEDLCPP